MKKDVVGEKTLENLEGVENYTLQVFKKIKEYMGKVVLEVGSGIGNNVNFIPENKKIILSDISPHYCKILKKRFPDLEVMQFNIELKAPRKLKNKVDTIICFNVLEHIKDDKKAIDNMYRLLKPKGRLILWVPAHLYLYNSFDKNLSHYRRYSKKMLENLLSTKFSCRYIKFNSLGTLGWFFYGHILKRKILPKGPLKIYNAISHMNVILDD